MYEIDTEKYIKYLNNNETLTKCQKKYFISKIYDKKINISKIMNKLILTYYKTCLEEENILAEAKLKLMIGHFTPYANVNNILDKIKHNEISTDVQVVLEIEKYNKTISKKDLKTTVKRQQITSICSNWNYIIENISQQIIKYFQNEQNNAFDTNLNIKYLDVSCGSGSKTVKFMKEINISKENTFGTDISNWGPYKQSENSYPFNFKLITNAGKLDFEDNFFDIITCNFALHHYENLSDMITEIKRVLKPNGLFVITEHNCVTNYDSMLINLLHLLFAFLYDKNKSYLEKPDYSQYFNFIEMDYILYEHNFKYIKGNFIYDEPTGDIRYDNIYYSIYTKI